MSILLAYHYISQLKKKIDCQRAKEKEEEKIDLLISSRKKRFS